MDAPHERRQPENDPQVIGRIGAVHVRAVAGSPQESSRSTGYRVLIVSPRVLWVARLRESLLSLGATCAVVRSLRGAREALSAGSPEVAALSDNRRGCAGASVNGASRPSFDAIMSDCALPDGDGMTLIAEPSPRGIPVIMAAKLASVDLAVCTMQHGAADLIEHATAPDAALAARVLGLAERSRNLRSAGPQGQRRLFRLGRAPALDKPDDRRQNDPAPSDLLHAPAKNTAGAEAEAHMNTVSTVSEFKGLIRGELDIESLLRTTLEFVLARSGPTNAAVFLPTTSGDYSLGAYVNYDCPKETCDVLLDHLANAVAPRFEVVKGMAHLTSPAALDEYLGDDADWLRGSHVVGFPCTHDNECLAIFMLFRDQRSTFAQPLLDQVKTVGELFAAQLARVIHIHHRHLPKSKWGMIGDGPQERDDYGDLAA